MRVVIVDDEPLAREGLRLMLADHPDVEVVGEAGNGRDALALVALRPDVWLLDIEMPGLDGLALAAALRPDAASIFVTAHERFAVRAFDLPALDYLLKPVDDRRLAVALDRVRVRCGSEPRIEVRDRSRTVYLDPAEIDWIEAADYYVEIHVGDRVYLHREPLKRLEERLGDRFVRIHRGRLVRRSRIREVGSRDGEAWVVLTDGTVLAVARSCRARLR